MGAVEVRFAYDNGWVQSRGHIVEADTASSAVRIALERGYANGCEGGRPVLGAVVDPSAPQYAPEPAPELPPGVCTRHVVVEYCALGAVFVRAPFHLVLPPGSSVVALSSTMPVLP